MGLSGFAKFLQPDGITIRSSTSWATPAIKILFFSNGIKWFCEISAAWQNELKTEIVNKLDITSLFSSLQVLVLYIPSSNNSLEPVYLQQK